MTQAEPEEGKRKAEVDSGYGSCRYHYRQTIKLKRLKEAEDHWKNQEAQIEKRLKAEACKKPLISTLLVFKTVSSRWSKEDS